MAGKNSDTRLREANAGASPSLAHFPREDTTPVMSHELAFEGQRPWKTFQS